MPNWWKTRDTVFATLLTLAGLAIGVGFLFRDRSFLNENLVPVMWGRAAILIVWGLTFLIFWLAFALYIGFRSGKLSRRNACFILVMIFGGGMIAYLPASALYGRTLAAKDAFHPFLQMIPPEIPERKNPDELLIACLGGSTTEFRDQVRWSELVEEKLQERFPDRELRVINQGKAWYTTQHSLINFEFNVRHAKPDIVIMMHSINDLTMNADHSYYSEGAFRSDYGHFYGPVSRFRRLKSFVGLIAEAGRRSWYWKPREVILENSFPGLPVFERNLERFVQLARLEEAIPVLMTQPSLYRNNNTSEEIEWMWLQRFSSAGPNQCWNHLTGKKGMQAYSDQVRIVAHKTGTPLVELEPLIPKDLKHFKDDCHYRRIGQEKIAAAVVESLTKLLDPKTAAHTGF